MEESIIAVLLGSSALTALVVDRIQPGRRPQGSNYPAVTLFTVDGAPEYADDGETGLTESRLQIDCWAKTYAEAKHTARAVKAALSDFQGTVGGVRFDFVGIDSERDLSEGGSNQADYLEQVSVDFIVVHTAQ